MAKQKRKVSMPAGIRNKMIAATSMLMVSCIMMVSSTYAWFTLSTAPEVKNISTTVAGNGSLEIALMPTTGLFNDIQTGNAGLNAGGNADVTVANTSWGNLITLSTDTLDYYGLKNLTMYPADLDITTNPESPLKTAVFGNDGRVSELVANTKLMKSESGGLFEITSSAPGYGVRAIVESDAIGETKTTYGYVLDFAVRLNTTTETGAAGNLLLQTDAKQRVYSDSSSADTLGGGSCMQLSAIASELLNDNAEYAKELLKAIRVTFVSNYGKVAADGENITVLGTARLDTSKLGSITEGLKIPLYLYNDPVEPEEGAEATEEEPTKKDTAVLMSLPKNEIKQISAIVWLDAANIKNSSLAATVMNSLTGTLNLQFTTDVVLNPAQNTGLKTPSTQ